MVGREALQVKPAELDPRRRGRAMAEPGRRKEEPRAGGQRKGRKEGRAGNRGMRGGGG